MLGYKILLNQITLLIVPIQYLVQQIHHTLFIPVTQSVHIVQRQRQPLKKPSKAKLGTKILDVMVSFA